MRNVLNGKHTIELEPVAGGPIKIADPILATNDSGRLCPWLDFTTRKSQRTPELQESVPN
jgi:hypothetical protein